MTDTLSAKTSKFLGRLGQVRVRPDKAGTFFARHPWVLDKSLIASPSPPQDGEEVDLLTQDGEFVARGIYNGNSRIRVRLYCWDASQPLDERFWRSRIERAVSLRREIGYDNAGGACRLIYSEADGLSGLIVDRYANSLVVQFTALAMAARSEILLNALREIARPQHVLVRAPATAIKAEGIEPRDEWLTGTAPNEEVVYEEHGLLYAVHFDESQKTGAYLDQRENRRAAAAYVQDRRVLDVCCYGGAFSLCAARLGGAKEMLGIDSSARAIEMARANAERNGVSNSRFECANCFDALEQMRAGGERFGAVILDPPRFAGSRREIDSALRAYHRLNRGAVELLEPGGILATCSCSAHVTREAFVRMLGGVARKSGRDIQILETRGAAPDHPVLTSCPESEYLKCLICRVL